MFGALVTPFVGVWIETLIVERVSTEVAVTPFVGVWIETGIRRNTTTEHPTSHPSWVCGLKHQCYQAKGGNH